MFEIYYPSIFGLSLNDTSTFPEYARYFFTFGISVAITLSVLTIIFGGVYYLISFGRGSFTSEGKEWIKAGATGLLLILGSYLIVYTINPDLAIFRLKGFTPILFNAPLPDPQNSNAPKVFYNEIPIGILAENVLSRTADCYNFDSQGNPISTYIEADSGRVPGPTLLDNDRTDCILKLSQAAAKKSEAIKNLADYIAGLMQQCSCQGKCDSTCDPLSPNACGQPLIDAEGNGTCPTGECKDGACKAFKNEPGECCSEDIKKQIEEGLDQFRKLQSNISSIVEKEIRVDNKPIKVIDIDKWEKLKTAEHLIYLKEKIDSFKLKIRKDYEQLAGAKNELNRCYVAMPYVEFLKLYQQTRPEEKVIMVNKNYFDGEKGGLINPSKYCKGFSYGNSSCFNTCQNICKGDSQQDLSCYKACPVCDPEDENCKEKQKICMEKCYNQRKCEPNNNFGNFSGCISYCKGQCSDSCSEDFSNDQEGLLECQKKCGNNSQCLLDNETKCIFSSQGLRQCLEKYTDSFYLKSCMDSSYLCKYGSDQNAGYPECLKPEYLKNNNYSASYIFQHQAYQLCKNPDLPYKEGAGSTCSDIYPETDKCPASSYCPNCPCDTVAGETKKEDQYSVVSGRCNEYAYNDDPLTFYCEQNWWASQNTKIESERDMPIGEKRYCLRGNEIPTGRTVDDTEKWAEALIKKLDEISKNANDLIGYIKKIGDEKNYCKCDSVCEQGRPCSTNCKYNEATTQTDADGNEISVPASCSVEPCRGISCQKIINLLKGGSTENCPVEQNGIGYYHDKIYNGYKDLYNFIVLEARSDILKELTYSRNQTSLCSLKDNSYKDRIKLFPCERAQDEIMPPLKDYNVTVSGKTVKSYCYGKTLGQYFIKENLTDNWFCCEQWQK